MFSGFSEARIEVVRLAKFGASGAINTLIGGAAILALQAAGTSPQLANAGGFAVGVPCGYLLNRRFVFESKSRKGGRLGRYILAVIMAFLANQLALAGALRLSGGGGVQALDQIAALATYTLTLFLLCRFWVFAESSPTAAFGLTGTKPLSGHFFKAALKLREPGKPP